MGELKKRIIRREKQRKQKLYIALAVFAVLVAALCIGVPLLLPDSAETAKVEEPKENKKEKKEQAMKEAALLAQTYAYDDAITVLQKLNGYENDADIQEQIAEIETTKASCVPVKLEEVTHIFYHSLVVDEGRAFANQDRNPQAAGNNQWMTTVDEFNAITQEMYNRGYVLVSIHDLYEVTTDESGAERWVPAEILLPPDKKAFVLSLDDLSYYHAYDNYGYAARLILDEDGKVVNEYYDAEGKEHIGAYDCVPLLDEFVEKHPDASYRGAKGIIALTGYNGILGYRSDETYDLSSPDCDIHQKAWIEKHPDFNLETERAEAKKVAEAMKANGWEFASHTWGHMRVGERSLSSIQVDTQRWKKNIEPLVGTVDTIIFAHGTDLEGEGAYSPSNERYQYLREQGFRIFCNVDSSAYTTFLGEDYMRQGRRNLDGYRIYYNAIGQQNNLSDLFDPKEILDPDRPPVKEL